MLFLQGVRNSSLRAGGGLCEARPWERSSFGSNLQQNVYWTTTDGVGHSEVTQPVSEDSASASADHQEDLVMPGSSPL